MSGNPTPNIDYTNKDFLSFKQMMIDGLKVKMPHYTDLSESDFGIVLIELLSKGLDILSYYQDSNVNEVYLSTATQRVNMDKWCYILGYTPKTATPSVFKQVFKLASLQPVPTLIPKGTVLKTTEYNTIEPPIFFETMQDFIIPPNKLGDEKTGEVYDYSVNVVHGISVPQDSIGSPNGNANQTFELSYSNCILNTLEIFVNEGFGYTKWTKVTSFVESTPISTHYKAKQNSQGMTEILFGDNSTGKIPLPTTNPVIAVYRVGGGTIGNVSVNTINSMSPSMAIVAETFNPFAPEIPGIDSEDMESIRRNAIAYANSKWSLITAGDFVAYLTSDYTSKILLSKAVPDAFDLFKMNIYLCMRPPYTVEDITVALTKDLVERTVPNGTITLFDASYTVQDVSMTLGVMRGFIQADVEDAVEDYITDYFTLGNIDFGEEVVMSSLIASVFANVNGVNSLVCTLPVADIIEGDDTKIITLGTLTLTTTGGIV